MTIIANPIYDCVFNYLLTDNAIAKYFLATLTGLDITEVKKLDIPRVSSKAWQLSSYRMYFMAVVRHVVPNQEQRIVIGLYKTWLCQENCSVRQYAGDEYLDMMKAGFPEDFDGDKLPVIAIYILAHKWQRSQEPVIYSYRRLNGLPEGIIPDRLIVQLPFLKEKGDNQLERMLSVFCQECCRMENGHLLQMRDEEVTDNVRLLVNRLVLAAASPGIRREMQVEDEILSEIEARDTAIMMKDKEIELKTQEIELKTQEIEQKSQEIEQKSQEIEQKSQEIEQQKSILRTTVRNLSQRGMSVKDIASVLAVSEEMVSALLSE